MTRRAVLGGAAAAVTAAWLPAFHVPASAEPGCRALPPGFPEGVEAYRQAYENWARQIRVDDLWTCAPRTALDVVRLADWARGHGYRLRPTGRRHGWSPFTVSPDETCDARVVLVDTTQHLTSVQVVDVDGPAVAVEAGVLLERLLEVLGDAGLGVTACPELGDITLGGVLAIGGHGTGVPAAGEQRPDGHTYGSLSNLVLSLTAVVHDGETGRYRLRTFSRDEPAAAAMLTGLGRCFITSAVLRVGADTMLRCRSITDIPAAELFGARGSGGRQLEEFLTQTGRVSALWLPFAEKPWLKVYELAPEQPAGSRRVDQPYNYPFTDSVPDALATLVLELVRGNGDLTPLFNQLSAQSIELALAATNSGDLWGASRNVLLSVRPSTLRIEQSGYAVLVPRVQVQRVVHAWTAEYSRLIADYAAAGRYPINMPVQIRVTGLDAPADLGLPTAATPALSALRPDPRHPERDTAVWLNAPTLTGTPGAAEFLRRLEQWMLAELTPFATVRPEWSKGWAYSEQAPWDDPPLLDGQVAASTRPARVAGRGPRLSCAAMTRTAYSPALCWTASCASAEPSERPRTSSGPLVNRWSST